MIIGDWNLSLNEWCEVGEHLFRDVVAAGVDPFTRNGFRLIGDIFDLGIVLYDCVRLVGCPFHNDHGCGDTLQSQRYGFFSGEECLL